jgi:hypothetical protein
VLSSLVLFQTNLPAVLWVGLAAPVHHSNPNSRPFNRLRPLFYPEPRRALRQKSQLLWSQANPASFSKMPGWGGHPDPVFGLSAGVDEDSRCRRRIYGTPGGVGAQVSLFLATRHSPLATLFSPGCGVPFWATSVPNPVPAIRRVF